jgi:hypothetical protein
MIEETIKQTGERHGVVTRIAVQNIGSRTMRWRSHSTKSASDRSLEARRRQDRQRASRPRQRPNLARALRPRDLEDALERGPAVRIAAEARLLLQGTEESGAYSEGVHPTLALGQSFETQRGQRFPALVSDSPACDRRGLPFPQPRLFEENAEENAWKWRGETVSAARGRVVGHERCASIRLSNRLRLTLVFRACGHAPAAPRARERLALGTASAPGVERRCRRRERPPALPCRWAAPRGAGSTRSGGR